MVEWETVEEKVGTLVVRTQLADGRYLNAEVAKGDAVQNRLDRIYYLACGDIDNLSEPVPKTPKYLGDHIEAMLTKMGITKEKVSEWIGHPCNCEERQERINALDKWARESAKGAYKNAKRRLLRLINVR